MPRGTDSAQGYGLPMAPENPLITPEELAVAVDRHQDGPQRPALLDVRWSLGAGAAANREAYLDGHLPGASFLDLESDLSDPVAPDGTGGRHPLPALQRVQQALRQAGVQQGQSVVCYDAGNSISAARAWWVLTYYGLADVRVLDGGLSAWERGGHPVVSGAQPMVPGDVTLTGGAMPILDADGLASFLAQGGQVLDARPADRFRGENETVDPVAGHIPGALSLPALSVFDEEGIVSAERLIELLTEVGADPSIPTAVYCGSGVQAAHLTLALHARQLTHQIPAVYVGSWSDWITDPRRPIATGS